MNLCWRFIWTLIFSRFQSKINFFDENTITLTVLPTDIDLFMHMNNGRYLSIMDLGRTNFIVRSGIFSILKKNRTYPVIASEMIRFRKSLDPFQRYQLTTRLLGWDEKFIYMVQHFKRHGEVCALAIIKCCFITKGKGRITSNELMTMLGHDIKSPAFPTWVNDWIRADQAFHDETIGDI